MRIHRLLHDAVIERARQEEIAFICMGLGYTAVQISSGAIGLAYTYFDRKTGCNLVQEYQDYEGHLASDLLPLINSEAPLERSMALALINALVQPDLVHLPADRDNTILFETLEIGPSTRVAMVGFFKPLVAIIESKGAQVAVLDEFRGMGEKADFYQKLSDWADAALITSTSLLNATFDDVMDHVGSTVRAALLGPSTPMAPEAFAPYTAIKALAGTVPVEEAPVLKAVRHGLGTPYLHRHSKKITQVIRDAINAR